MVSTTNKTTKQYMTILEIADYLGLDYFHVYKLLNNDKTMSYQQYGRKKLWLRADIENFKTRHLITPNNTQEV